MRACSSSSPIRISPTPDSTSSIDTARHHSFRLDDAGDADDLVASHDERPGLAIRPGNLRVDEDVLHLLRTAGEPVARPPPADTEPGPARSEEHTSELQSPCNL